MSAVEARSALAAGVGSTKAPSKRQGSAQGCTRKPGSVTTSCRCSDECRALAARREKWMRCGWTPPAPQTDKARTRLRSWIAAGWSPLAIASVTGMNPAAVYQLVQFHRDEDHPMQHSTVRAILTATARPTAGLAGTTGARRQLQALAWMGWGLADIAGHAGIERSTLSNIRRGVAAQTHVDVLARLRQTYTQLEGTRGPSDRARTDARRNHWAPPAAWDDDTIDDPDTTPEGVIGPRGEGQGRPASTDDTVLARIRELTHAGLTDAEIGRHIGRTRAAVEKLRNRHGIRRAA